MTLMNSKISASTPKWGLFYRCKEGFGSLRSVAVREAGEDTEVLNFTTKIAPAGVSVELGHGDSQSPTPVTKGKGKKRKDPQIGDHPDSDLVIIMKDVAHYIKYGSGTKEEPRALNCSRLGAHGQACKERIMRLLSQTKSLWEWGLNKESPDVVTVIEAEIKSCKDTMRHFKNEEQIM